MVILNINLGYKKIKKGAISCSLKYDSCSDWYRNGILFFLIKAHGFAGSL